MTGRVDPEILRPAASRRDAGSTEGARVLGAAGAEAWIFGLIGRRFARIPGRTPVERDRL